MDIPIRSISVGINGVEGPLPLRLILIDMMQRYTSNIDPSSLEWDSVCISIYRILQVNLINFI